MKRYTFDVREEREPYRELRVEAPGRASLGELARRLQAGFDLLPGEAWSFCRHLHHDEDYAFGPEFQARHDAERTLLERLALRPRARMTYEHGRHCAPPRLSLRVVAVGEGDGAWDAPPPVAAPPRAEPSTAARARALLARSAAAVGLDPAARRALRREELAFARELLEMPDGPGSFAGLARRMDLEDWVAGLPLAAAEAGLVDEALAFAQWYAVSCGEPRAFVARARILAREGRRAEALEQLDDLLVHVDDEPELARAAAAACLGLDEPARAERFLRAAIAYRGRDGRAQRAQALQDLCALLARQGRASEAEAATRVAREADECFDPEGEDELFEHEAPSAALLVPPTDPCPCGSGRTLAECCLAAGEELEFERLCRLLDPLMDEVIDEDPDLFARDFERVLGPEFAGLAFPEIPPLLPDFQLEWVYMHWFTLDRAHPPALLRRMERHPELDARDRELLERAAASHVGLYRVRNPGDGRGLTIRDVLTGTELRSDTGASVLFYCRVQLVLARFIQLDGDPTPMAHVLFVPEGHEQAMLALAKERYAAFRKAHRGLAGTALAKAFAPELIGAWYEAVHADPD